MAMTHVSNILGEVMDVGAIQKAVRELSSAHLVVDGVAYAPHLPMDVTGWDVDWYVFSTYKVFGPHLAALYGRHAVLDAVKTGAPNHYFVPVDDPVYKFELGSASHEGCGGIIAVGEYLQFMAGVGNDDEHVSPVRFMSVILCVWVPHQQCHVVPAPRTTFA